MVRKEVTLKYVTLWNINSQLQEIMSKYKFKNNEKVETVRCKFAVTVRYKLKKLTIMRKSYKNNKKSQLQEIV